MTLRELQLFALEILKDVHSFCEKNHIKYSLYGGTLLGAIRHKGFIPWDDDIDIIMPRQEYDRFCATYKSDAFELVNFNIDKSFSYSYSRICDKKKTMYTAKYPCNKEGMGVWIDVFPADGFPVNEKDIPAFYQKILSLEKKKIRLRSGLYSYSSTSTTKTTRDIYMQFRHNFGIFFRKVFLFINGWRNPFVKKQIELCHRYTYGTTPFWGSITAPYNHVVYHPLIDFESCELHPFEDSLFYILKGYDGLLRRVYGDYMQLPQEEKRVPPLKGIYTFYWI